MWFDSFPIDCDKALGERSRMVRRAVCGCQPLICPDGWIAASTSPNQPSSRRTATLGRPPVRDFVSATTANPASRKVDSVPV